MSCDIYDDHYWLGLNWKSVSTSTKITKSVTLNAMTKEQAQAYKSLGGAMWVRQLVKKEIAAALKESRK